MGWFGSAHPLLWIQVPEALGLSYKLANQLNQNHWYSASWIAKVHSKGDCDGWGGFWCLFPRHYWVHSKSIQRPKLCSLPGFYSWKALCRWGQDDTTVPWYVHREMVVGYPGMSYILESTNLRQYIMSPFLVYQIRTRLFPWACSFKDFQQFSESIDTEQTHCCQCYVMWINVANQ